MGKINSKKNNLRIALFYILYVLICVAGILIYDAAVTPVYTSCYSIHFCVPEPLGSENQLLAYTALYYYRFFLTFDLITVCKSSFQNGSLSAWLKNAKLRCLNRTSRDYALSYYQRICLGWQCLAGSTR